MAGAMEHQAALLLGRLGWHKPHVGPGHCFADGLCVSGVILLPFDVGLHVGGRHQPHRVSQGLELTRPMMRGGAGLDADQAWRQLLKERQNVATLQLTADDRLASSINAMHLKPDLAMSRPTVVTVCMFGSSESWGLNSTHYLWHSCAGGGAVHSITSGLLHRSKQVPYSITSSARTRIISGMVIPRALAVLRFTTSSNLAGRSIGRSAGLVPPKIRP